MNKIKKFFLSKDKTHVILRIRGYKNNGDILIDRDDYYKIKDFSWKIEDNKYVRATKGRNPTISYSLHKLILGEKEGYNIDHINRNPLDNRKENLRFVSQTVNNLNRSKMSNNTSGRTGVRYREKNGIGRWVGQYEVNGKRYEKSFSINKYGYDEAYNLALKFREKGELKHNILTEK